MTALPTTEGKIDDFSRGVRIGHPAQGALDAAHLLAEACYVHRLGQVLVIDHMRQCVRRCNESVVGKNTATSGDHETITVFWIKVLDTLFVPIDREKSPHWLLSAMQRSATCSGASMTSRSSRLRKLAKHGYHQHSKRLKTALLCIWTSQHNEDRGLSKTC
jgi:hypothetical protein